MILSYWFWIIHIWITVSWMTFLWHNWYTSWYIIYLLLALFLIAYTYIYQITCAFGVIKSDRTLISFVNIIRIHILFIIFIFLKHWLQSIWRWHSHAHNLVAIFFYAFLMPFVSMELHRRYAAINNVSLQIPPQNRRDSFRSFTVQSMDDFHVVTQWWRVSIKLKFIRWLEFLIAFAFFFSLTKLSWFRLFDGVRDGYHALLRTVYITALDFCSCNNLSIAFSSKKKIRISWNIVDELLTNFFETCFAVDGIDFQLTTFFPHDAKMTID